jgi:hypothetical protein
MKLTDEEQKRISDFIHKEWDEINRTTTPQQIGELIAKWSATSPEHREAMMVYVREVCRQQQEIEQAGREQERLNHHHSSNSNDVHRAEHRDLRENSRDGREDARWAGFENTQVNKQERGDDYSR